MTRSTVIIVSFLAMLLPMAAAAMSRDSCRMVKMEAERLPDLNIPRNAHAAFCVNGEVTVVGGHTTSFIPTATAEYFKDGKWHLMETEYAHDNGICVVQKAGGKSGKVILAGGHAEPLGVGQTFAVEEYDPVTHTFRGFSCLDKKRTLATGTELDSGRIVVAGNWYAGDGIELFDGDRKFSHLKDVAVERASPYMLRTARDNVLILGNGDTHGEVLLTDVVDQLKGEPLHVPLLRQWQPLFCEAPFCADVGFIGDEAAGDYSWLLPVQDWTVGDNTDWLTDRPLAFLLVRDTTQFSLLPTTCTPPVKSRYGPILYYSPVIADRQAHRGYLHGIDRDNRHYVLCVEYDKTPSPLTLYYTDPLPEAGFPEIVLTDEGDLMIVGGITYNKGLNGTLQNDNFSPVSTVYLLHVGNRSDDNALQKAANSFFTLHFSLLQWLGILLALAILAAAVAVLVIRRWRGVHTPEPADAAPAGTPAADSDETMMQRIRDLMEQQQPYLNSSLKLSDVAAMLGTNRNVVSNCINSQQGCSFSQFVNDYRVGHAQQLMRRQPDRKISEVWLSSGFSTESSFFRAFKAVIGVTPSEWKTRND